MILFVKKMRDDTIIPLFETALAFLYASLKYPCVQLEQRTDENRERKKGRGIR